ncbi:MAG: hypothetical protein QOJ50_3308 [Cryptosporangiaceae bacterium]|nr:hypothetical protein [Cryptosporangiaceae bacterium]MDT5009817.1 hypothetical protein [Mycobacterium sp.]
MSLRKSAIRPGWDDPLVTVLQSLIEAAGGLSVVAHAAEGRVPASLVNAGLIEHPTSGRPVLAHVAYGDSRRVTRLAANPECSATFHDGRKWLTAEGNAQLVHGPWDERSTTNDPALRFGEARYAELLRTVYRCAGGGEHPDWSEFDRAMRAERRVVVLVDVERLYGIHWD